MCEQLTAVIPPMMAMKTDAIAEMTASMARPIAEMIPPYEYEGEFLHHERRREGALTMMSVWKRGC